MSTAATHKQKYEMFKRDAENESVSIPTRIESYFNASFHLIEFYVARKEVHINKHQLVRTMLNHNKEIFGEKTEDIWRAFQELENQIRPGQIYGGSVDGEKLRMARELFERIVSLCGECYESKK